MLALLQYNKFKESKNDNRSWSRPPDIDEFQTYVKAHVGHFQDSIHYWEVWNEPNHPVYWSGPKDNLQTYCRLLKATYATIKSLDPQSVVLNGGLTSPLIEDVQNLYRNGGKDFTDVLSVHLFIDPNSKNRREDMDRQLAEIHALMIQAGDSSKKVWITEMGCPGNPRSKMELGWFGGKPVSETQQADWLKEIYAGSQKHPFVEKIFWAFYRDTKDEFKDANRLFRSGPLSTSPPNRPSRP